MALYKPNMSVFLHNFYVTQYVLQFNSREKPNIYDVDIFIEDGNTVMVENKLYTLCSQIGDKKVNLKKKIFYLRHIINTFKIVPHVNTLMLLHKMECEASTFDYKINDKTRKKERKNIN